MIETKELFSPTKNTSQISDEQLMLELGQGNKASFDRLYTRYAEKIYYFFYRMMRNNKEASEDLVQNIFMKLIEKPELFDSKKKFKPWFYSIAYNMCKNEFKKNEVRKVMQSVPELEIINGHSKDILPDQALEEKRFIDEMHKHLKDVTPENKTAFLLKHRDGFALKEISETIGIPEGTVKSKIHYTVKYLSEKLNDYKTK